MAGSLRSIGPLVLAVSALTACTLSRPSGVSESRPATSVVAAPVLNARNADSVLSDTEEDLIPNPDLRTWNRLWALRNWIRRYQTNHGALPERIEDFLTPGHGGLDLEHDAWGNAIVYVRTGETFELRAIGKDGRRGTGDDMVATADCLPPRPVHRPAQEPPE